jgi:hypothetical protein
MQEVHRKKGRSCTQVAGRILQVTYNWHVLRGISDM